MWRKSLEVKYITTSGKDSPKPDLTLAAKMTLNVTKYVRRWIYLVWTDSSQCPLNVEHNDRVVNFVQGGLAAAKFGSISRNEPPISLGYVNRVLNKKYGHEHEK